MVLGQAKKKFKTQSVMRMQTGETHQIALCFAGPDTAVETRFRGADEALGALAGLLGGQKNTEARLGARTFSCIQASLLLSWRCGQALTSYSWVILLPMADPPKSTSQTELRELTQIDGDSRRPIAACDWPILQTSFQLRGVTGSCEVRLGPVLVVNRLWTTSSQSIDRLRFRTTTTQTDQPYVIVLLESVQYSGRNQPLNVCTTSYLSALNQVTFAVGTPSSRSMDARHLQMSPGRSVIWTWRNVANPVSSASPREFTRSSQGEKFSINV